MPSLADLVSVPPGKNSGLSACREDTMLEKFGRPGALTDKSSAITSDNITRRIRYGVDGLRGSSFGPDFLGAIQRTSRDLQQDTNSWHAMCSTYQG